MEAQGVVVRDATRERWIGMAALAALSGLGRAWPAVESGIWVLGIAVAAGMAFRWRRAKGRLVAWEADGRLHLRGRWLTRAVDCAQLAAVGFYYRGHEPAGVRVVLRSGAVVDSVCLGYWIGNEARAGFADSLEAFCHAKGWRFDPGSGRWRS